MNNCRSRNVILIYILFLSVTYLYSRFLTNYIILFLSLPPLFKHSVCCDDLFCNLVHKLHNIKMNHRTTRFFFIIRIRCIQWSESWSLSFQVVVKSLVAKIVKFTIYSWAPFISRPACSSVLCDSFQLMIDVWEWHWLPEGQGSLELHASFCFFFLSTIEILEALHPRWWSHKRSLSNRHISFVRNKFLLC